MKFVLYTNSVSPHQLPLYNEISRRLGVEECRYVYTQKANAERLALGWEKPEDSSLVEYSKQRCHKMLRDCEFLYSTLRDVDLFEARASNGKKTIYLSERWFKPPFGILRLFHPAYFITAWRIRKLLLTGSAFYYYPIGVWAARDMARLCGLLGGDLRCLFRSPDLTFERFPGGCVGLNVRTKRFGTQNMRLWGYFVAPSQVPARSPLTTNNQVLTTARAMRVLWVGRMLALKRVDTLIKALKSCLDRARTGYSLTIVGSGPEERRLKKLARKLNLESAIAFRPPVPISEVRSLMRTHDVYVLPSNGYEGWGGVVSEALEEGMRVLGADMAGACATILPPSNLFHVGDWRMLGAKLENGVASVDIGKWNVCSAADWLLKKWSSCDAGI